MSESTGTKRLNAVVKELNVGMQTLVEHLAKKGHSVDAKPTTKLSDEQYNILLNDFHSEKKTKEESKQLSQNKVKPKDVTIEQAKPKVIVEDDYEDEVVVVKSGLTNKNEKQPPVVKTTEKVVEPVAEEKTIEKATPIETPIVEKAPKPLVETVAEEKEEPKETKTTPVEVKAPIVSDKADDDDTPKLTVLGKIDLDALNTKTRPDKKAKDKKQKDETKPVAPKEPEVKVVEKTIEETPVSVAESKKEVVEPTEKVSNTPPVENNEPEDTAPQVMETNYEKLSGLKVMGKIQLPVEQPKTSKPIASSDANNKKKRKRNNYIGGSDTANDKLNKFGKSPSNEGGNTGTPRTPYQGNNNNAGGARTGYQGNNNNNGPRTPYQGNNNNGGARPPFNRNNANNKTGGNNFKPAEKRKLLIKKFRIN